MSGICTKPSPHVLHAILSPSVEYWDVKKADALNLIRLLHRFNTSKRHNYAPPCIHTHSFNIGGAASVVHATSTTSHSAHDVHYTAST